MKKIERKIIKDIYKGRITTFNDFLEKYIATNKKIPQKYASEYQKPGENNKYYFIPSKEYADEKLQIFKESLSFLYKEGFITIEQQPRDYIIYLIIQSGENKSWPWDPCGVYPTICIHKIVPVRIKLRPYIRRGCRTKSEHKLFLKNFWIEFRLTIVFILTILSFIFTYILKSNCSSQEKQINQKASLSSPVDTLKAK